MAVKPTSIPPFPEAEYMLVISPEEHLQERIARVRQSLSEKTGIRTREGKTHITLARWQAWDMMEERLLQRLRVLAMEQYPFQVQMEDFKGFPSHTVCIQVPTREPILRLVARVRKHKRLMRSMENDPYFVSEPYLTIARGLTAPQYEQAMQVLGGKHFHASFVASAMLLLKRRAGGQPYQILARFDFEHLPVTARQASLFA
ncbi:2'-5' RNA ligase family protein [Dinghuibacter silviterrae]|uniref:2'-5' RNA ligase superfamily protein n=1 Tax=Dinghuibacter silviterrae TaxID=1539049 RepID=A0A4R8DQ27_9BACT|nr:2'-5' RNA ligase family protein [Dinghuibacter silviterrae]TDW99998.1 2'-5' RNA ligase superfamily protein [Dinghuibacter silviterrae]